MRLQTLYCTDDSDGSYANPLWLTDLSASGARLRGRSITELPDSFLLSVKGHEGGVWHCEVAWRSEDEIGVRFVDLGRRTERAAFQSDMPDDRISRDT